MGCSQPTGDAEAVHGGDGAMAAIESARGRAVSALSKVMGRSSLELLCSPLYALPEGATALERIRNFSADQRLQAQSWVVANAARLLVTMNRPVAEWVRLQNSPVEVDGVRKSAIVNREGKVVFYVSDVLALNLVDLEALLIHEAFHLTTIESLGRAPSDDDEFPHFSGAGSGARLLDLSGACLSVYGNALVAIDLFVDGVYRDALNRAPTLEEREHERGELAAAGIAGSSRQEIARRLTSSTAGRATLLDKMYRQMIGSPPPAGSLDPIAALGIPAERSFLTGVFGGTAFLALSDGTVGGFVLKLNEVLTGSPNRPGSFGESLYTFAVMQLGTNFTSEAGRSSFVSNYLGLIEVHERHVSRLYEFYLGRPATVAEQERHSALVWNATTNLDSTELRILLLGSEEYFFRVTHRAN